MKISDEKVVLLTYDLTIDEGDSRDLMEHVPKEYPLTFMFGMGMMLEAFEKNIEGLEVGDKFSFSLTPQEAYGEYDEEHVIELPKKIFEVDGKFDKKRISNGETLPMMDSEGNRLTGFVMEVKQDTVLIDFNHPLAGEKLYFDGEIIDVHEPTIEEIATLTHENSCDCGDCGSNQGGCNGCC
jgi:FKBP-type peptidyl-prolyl cis-trans isomerase SlyD